MTSFNIHKAVYYYPRNILEDISEDMWMKFTKPSFPAYESVRKTFDSVGGCIHSINFLIEGKNYTAWNKLKKH